MDATFEILGPNHQSSAFHPSRDEYPGNNTPIYFPLYNFLPSDETDIYDSYSLCNTYFLCNTFSYQEIQQQRIRHLKQLQ